MEGQLFRNLTQVLWEYEYDWYPQESMTPPPLPARGRGGEVG